MNLEPTRSIGGKPFSKQNAPEAFVLGGGPLGVAVARRLLADGQAVTLVDDAQEPDGVPSIPGDPGDVRLLERAGLADASMVVVAMQRDRQNLLVAQLVRTNFGVEDIVVLVRSPDRCELIESADLESVCATTSLTDVLVEAVDARTREESQTA